MEGSGDKTIQSGQESQQNKRHCMDMLPFEMWQEILLKLNGKGAHKTLLSCRGVCINLELVAENVLFGSVAEQLRKMQDHVEYNWRSRRSSNEKLRRIINKQIGTRFENAEDVRLFLAQMVGQQGSPFPNGYIIYSPSSKLKSAEIQRFHMAFETLVDAFPGLITTLFYDVSHVSSIGLLVLLSTIFKLRNLQNLIVCDRKGAKIDLASLETLMENGSFKFPQVPAINQLHFYGSSEKSISQIIRIFGLIQPFENSTIHLGFQSRWSRDGWGWRLRNDLPVTLPPCLKHLKIIDPNILALEHFLVSTDNHTAPKLTEIDIHFGRFYMQEHRVQDYSYDESQIIRILRALDTQQSQTLERMNWNTDFRTNFNFSNKKPPLSTDVKYPKLTHFSISYCICYCILRNWRTLITQLQEKFPSLEIFTVTAGRNSNQDLCGKRVGRRAIYDVVSTLWEIFPATSNLREIQVPYYNWTLTRDGPLPLGVLPDIE